MRVFYFFLFLALGIFSTQSLSQTPVDIATEETAIRDLITQYMGTRAQNNEQGLLALLTEDIDQLTTSGLLRSGRIGVSSGSLASSQSNSGKRSITVESIRFIKPDVAIVNGRYDIVDRSTGPDSHYLTSIVVVMEDQRWLISAIRNMQPTQ
jgi:uncharacterized protein (TIGR02246 family)